MQEVIDLKDCHAHTLTISKHKKMLEIVQFKNLNNKKEEIKDLKRKFKQVKEASKDAAKSAIRK